MPEDKSLYDPAETSVMLLAAGRGKRMGNLGLDTPKPLLQVGERSLIEHHLYRLAELGFADVVVNLAHLGPQISAQLQSGDCYGLNIRYSDESQSGALETAGGIRNALPMLRSDPFIVINADIWTDFDFSALLQPLQAAARLVMVPNPAHNPEGDFYLTADGRFYPAPAANTERLTFSGIGLYRKSLFEGLKPGKQALAPILQRQIELNQLHGLVYRGTWIDIGTPERLRELNASLGARPDGLDQL
ncbi:MAG: nucleotidyltransferase family protein [Arenicella sp.]|nr:nucleotidyltransferase family protein [Arenicella sp.]